MDSNELYQDTNPENLRLPPHSVESEQSVLGSLLLDNMAWERIADRVGENDFYRVEHRLIYRCIAHLIDNNKPADIITVQEELERLGQLNDAGGLEYLALLARNTPSAANITRYAEIVRERSIMRQLADAGTAITRMTYQPEGRSADDMLDEAEQSVFQIAESSAKHKQGFLTMPTLLAEAMEHVQMLYERGDYGGITGLATGFTELDKITAGLQNGDLIIVAGRPSMGKTSFAMNIAEHAGIFQKKAVAVFSMEMGASQLILRMLGSVARIDQHALRTGSLKEDQWPQLGQAFEALSDAPIFIDETPGLTALELRARARRLARQQKDNLGLIVIDYLQLMVSHKNNQNRATELSEISRSLKALAKELNVPIIALSQLSRKCEERPDKRPIMSDLRESGAIEQDADLIIFMYRDIYYHSDSQYKDAAEALIRKHRNGPTGKVWLTFLDRFARFENSTIRYDDNE